MTETITVNFPEIAGDSADYTAFLRAENGPILNTGGDLIAETASPGSWRFELGETRVENRNYLVRIYAGTTEVADNLVYDGVLYSGQTIVDKEFQPLALIMIRGTVGASPAPTTTALTVSYTSTTPGVVDQWKGRVIIFNNSTTTAALRGQAVEIVGSSADAHPQLTYTALTTAPVSGDNFSIV